MVLSVDPMCMSVLFLKLLPCCDHSCRTRSPGGHSGIPQGISAILKADEDLLVVFLLALVCL